MNNDEKARVLTFPQKPSSQSAGPGLRYEHQDRLYSYDQLQELARKERAQKKAAKEKLKKRFYAFGTDLFLIGVLQKIIVLSYVNFINNTFNQAPAAIRANLLGHLGQLRLSTLVFTFFSYFLISYFLGHGKTPGKTIFHLRVLSHEGDAHELSFMESFMRTLGYTCCYVLGSFLFLIAAFRSDQRGIPDFFSQTEVITEDEFEAYLNQLQDLQEAPKSSPKEVLASTAHDTEGDQLDLFAS